jgi:protoporphyrin/coproporphyrin ferrochelatase
VTTGVVLMAYGTPRSPAAIEAYYTDIRRGRAPSAEQLAELKRRYAAIGGTSPLVQVSESQRDGLHAALDQRAPAGFVVELGYKHAAPSVEDAVAALQAAEVDRVTGLVLAPHYSALSIGEYLARAGAAAGAAGLPFAGIESWATEPAYVAFLAAEVRRRLDQMPPNTKVVFTAHSLPRRILADGDPYPDEVRATAAAVGAALGLAPWAQWSVAWQSAGRTPEPWLVPDVLTVIDELAGAENADGVLVCPCGFVADHLEVLYDLDIEARRRAEQQGLVFDRTASMNAEPSVLAALADRVIAIA